MRRSIAVVLVSAAVTLGIGWLARAPYSPPGREAGMLRLSWRLRGERAKECRPRTQAELDALPVHMRSPQVCEARLVTYQLIVRLDHHAPDTTLVLPGGSRGDRPVYVFREIALTPGRHRVRVRFNRADHRHHHNRAALSIETNVLASPGRIELITLDENARRLVHVRGEAH